MKVQIEFREYGESEFRDVTDDASMFEVNENTSNHSSAEGFAGCYRVRMIDPYGNPGPYSDTLCVEPCPLYRLPNVFTPNGDRKSTRLNSSHVAISYAVFCLKKKKT